MWPAGKSAGWRAGGGASHDKIISSSAAGTLSNYSILKKLLHMVLTFKYYNNEFSDFYFSFRLYST